MKRAGWLLWAGIGVSALCTPILHRAPARLVYNATPSTELGWYVIGARQGARTLRAGSVALVRLPSEAALLAAHRGYLPEALPLLKRVAAAAPQSVCIDAQGLHIDGAYVAPVREHDGQGRPLPVWRQCRHLHAGELFLLGDARDASFDSRYFGTVDASMVLGEAHPVWTWSK